MDDSLRPRIEAIVGKLSKARALKRSCFGSEAHDFRLGPPLPEAEIDAFEAEKGVRLPAAYRAFLIYAGQGGAGPYYGLYRLRQWDDAIDVEATPDCLLRPCPFQPGPNAWTETVDDLDGPYVGTIAIGTQGCGLAIQLIITGPSRGRVAYIDYNAQTAYVSRSDDFLDWYERWLDEHLAGYRTSWFGYGPGGDAAALFAILADPRADDDLKGEAAQGLSCLPSLLSFGAIDLIPLLTHPLTPVRAGAIAAIGVFKLKAALAPVSGRLNDPSPAVRQAAITTLMTLAPSASAPAVKAAMVHEPDRDVASTAFFKLKAQRALTRSDQLLLMGPKSSGHLRGLCAYDFDWSAADIPLATALLQDQDPQARMYAVLALSRLKARAAMPELLACLDRETDAHVIDSILGAFNRFADGAAAPALRRWALHCDDFHRLNALQALITLADAEAAQIAATLLTQNRCPTRTGPGGMSAMSHIKTIPELVREMLRKAPDRALRALAK